MVNTHRFSVKDYHAIIDTGILEGKNVELINGEIIEMSPEKPIHSGLGWRTSKYLDMLFGKDFIIRSGHPITLDDSEPSPDIAIALFDENGYIDRHPNALDLLLVLEISNSTLSFDLGEKKRIYARNGIKNYWVLDVNGKCLWVFSNPENDQFLTETVVSEGELEIPELSGIKINISRILNF
jgi:Uma2 family endonuclease